MEADRLSWCAEIAAHLATELRNEDDVQEVADGVAALADVVRELAEQAKTGVASQASQMLREVGLVPGADARWYSPPAGVPGDEGDERGTTGEALQWLLNETRGEAAMAWARVRELEAEREQVMRIIQPGAEPEHGLGPVELATWAMERIATVTVLREQEARTHSLALRAEEVSWLRDMLKPVDENEQPLPHRRLLDRIRLLAGC